MVTFLIQKNKNPKQTKKMATLKVREGIDRSDWFQKLEFSEYSCFVDLTLKPCSLHNYKNLYFKK